MARQPFTTPTDAASPRFLQARRAGDRDDLVDVPGGVGGDRVVRGMPPKLITSLPTWEQPSQSIPANVFDGTAEIGHAR